LRVKVKLLILMCVLFIMLPFSPTKSYGIETAVRDVEVTLQDYVVDRPVNYFIRFITSQTLLGGRDMITIKFPAEVNISENINRENISFNGFTTESIDYDENILKVLVPSGRSVQYGELVEIGIASAAIRNPRVAGDYSVSVYTSLDVREVQSRYFTITDYEYSDGVSKPTVKLEITEESDPPAYEIIFKTSLNGRLSGGTDKVMCEFAAGTGIPSSIDGRYITINGITLAGQIITPSGRTLALPLPLYLNIPAKGQVKINISYEAGLTRPANTYNTYNTLKVWTTVETRAITSFEYETTNSEGTDNQAVNFQVVLSPDGINVPAAYAMQIVSGYLTDSNADDYVSGFILSFPAGTGLPAVIATEHIKVNGTAVGGILSDPLKKEIIFTLPAAISLQQAINIQIDKAAGIINSAVAADYKMEIRPLSSPKSWTSSFFSIRPVSSVVTNPVVSTPVGTSPAKQIQLRINSSLAVIDGVSNTLDAMPVIVNDVTLVPLRFISTALGAKVDYVEAGKYASVEDSTKKIILWVDSRTAKINDEFQLMTQAAKIINDRLMVPLRFISENFGLTVSWNGATETVTIVQGQAAGDTTVTAEVVTQPVDTYPIGYKAYIKAENTYCNLRLGPGLNYTKTGEALPGEALTVLLEQEGWYRIRTTSQEEAWIAGWMVDIPRS